MKLVSKVGAAVLQACEAAARLQQRGEFEKAAEALEEWWSGPGTEPRVEGLGDLAAAELLLTVGSLTGQLGSSAQTANPQEIAKNLLTRASEAFLRLNLPNKIAETHAAMAICYWRNGSFDEARSVLRGALSLRGLNNESRLRIMIALAIVEEYDGKRSQAIAIYSDAADLCTPETGHYLTGTYHMNFAIALKNVNEIDRSLMESTAAAFHLEQCGHLRYQARVHNNIAMLLLKAARYSEAQENAARAERILRTLGDHGTLAQILDTRAQIYLAQNKFHEAERASRTAVQVLERGDEKKVLVDAIVTRATVLIKLDKINAALDDFTKAYEIAHAYLGEMTGAKILTRLIEELAGHAYVSAQVGLEKAVDGFEARLIKEALQMSAGRITEAAFRLQMSHQALDFILEGRQKELKQFRAPKRRSTVMKPNKVSKIR